MDVVLVDRQIFDVAKRDLREKSAVTEFAGPKLVNLGPGLLKRKGRLRDITDHRELEDLGDLVPRLRPFRVSRVQSAPGDLFGVCQPFTHPRIFPISPSP